MAAVVSGLFLMAGCTEKYEISYLDEIQLSQTFISIPAEGGKATVTLNAATDWAFDKIFGFETDEYENCEPVMEYKELPEWLTVNKLSGEAGDYELVFSAELSEAGREASLVILAGDKMQNLTVRQGEIAASEATCEEIIAAPDGQSFTVTGICTSIESTTYGNWRLNDGTGEILIYGTLDDTGQYNWSSFGIEVGDEVTVRGPKTTYNGTVELVDVRVVEVNKSLLQSPDSKLLVSTAGGDVTARFVVKGDGLLFELPSEMQSWAQVTDVAVKDAVDTDDPDTTVVTINVAATGDAAMRRAGNIKFRSSSSAGSSEIEVEVVQYPDAISLTDAFAKIDAENPYVTVNGVIAATCTNGFLLSADNDLIFVYINGEFEYDEFKDKAGHQVRISGRAGKYNSGAQIASIDMLEIGEKTGYTETAAPVTLDAAKIDEVIASADSYLDVTYFEATGTLSDPYHNLNVSGTPNTLAFYGNDSDNFDLNKYHQAGKSITVRGYYVSKQLDRSKPTGRINFIVTSVQ